MAVRRFVYVQGAGKRKHILLDGKTETVCGVWYFGKTACNPQEYPPNSGAQRCKHCDNRV